MENIESVPIVQNKKTVKISALFLIMLFSLIAVSIYISGLFGPNFLRFFIFMIMFLLPILIIFRNVFLHFLPQFIKDNLNIIEEKKGNEYDPVKDITVETKRNDYFKMIIGFLCIASTIFFVFIPTDGSNIVYKNSNQTADVSVPSRQTQRQEAAKNNVNKKVNPKIKSEGNRLSSAALRNAVASNTSSNTTTSTQTGGTELSHFSRLGYGLFLTLMGLYITSQGL
jgi:hypothetical protein